MTQHRKRYQHKAIQFTDGLNSNAENEKYGISFPRERKINQVKRFGSEVIEVRSIKT